MKDYYCENCDKRVPSHIEKQEETLPVKGEPVKIIVDVRICDICNGACYDQELDSASMLHAFDIYRKRHNLIFPSEIISLRTKYGLSQRGLAALLGWGEVTIHRYEQGSLPDEAHNQILYMLRFPENMVRLFEIYKDRLPPTSRGKLAAKLAQITGKPAKKPAKKPGTASTVKKARTKADPEK
jgi:putative zinc finger/helix-turn-helix YgiT family protein